MSCCRLINQCHFITLFQISIPNSDRFELEYGIHMYVQSRTTITSHFSTHLVVVRLLVKINHKFKDEVTVTGY